MFRPWNPPSIQQIPPPVIQELPIAHLNEEPNQIQLEQSHPMETNQVST